MPTGTRGIIPRAESGALHEEGTVALDGVNDGEVQRHIDARAKVLRGEDLDGEVWVDLADDLSDAAVGEVRVLC